MHVTARVDHAISAAIALPEPTEKPVAGAALALELGLSYPYLLTIIDPLKKAGLATVRRGPHGGLSLARRSDDITLADVIWAVDAPLDFAGRQSLARAAWSSRTPDPLPRLWATARDAVFAVFSPVLLADVRAASPSASRSVSQPAGPEPEACHPAADLTEPARAPSGANT